MAENKPTRRAPISFRDTRTMLRSWMVLSPAPCCDQLGSAFGWFAVSVPLARLGPSLLSVLMLLSWNAFFFPVIIWGSVGVLLTSSLLQDSNQSILLLPLQHLQSLAPRTYACSQSFHASNVEPAFILVTLQRGVRRALRF